MKPLDGILVVEIAQYLSGPFAGLKLADLGARVIKVERPVAGDPCRQILISEPVSGENPLFHAINRGKESIAIDFRNAEDMGLLRAILKSADVMIQNFRPGVIERQGLGWDVVRAINPRLVYGSISGFGPTEWAALPGQDLLAQARSGLMWLTGRRDDPPLPMGLAVADMLAGEALTQGILAALVARGRTGRGEIVETSLLEAMMSFQFEVLTVHLNDGGRLPERATMGAAHAYIGAPYGVYPTKDGWLAIAMVPSLDRLGKLMEIPSLANYGASLDQLKNRRDEIQAIVAKATVERTTEQWLSVLEPADIWCAEVLDWPKLMKTEAFQTLDVVRAMQRGDVSMRTVRGPLRLGGKALYNGTAAPSLGESRQQIEAEFGPTAIVL